MTKTAIKTLPEIEDLIEKALTRINGTNANDICRYLPGNREGYMHHFTLQKLASNDPEKLSEMLHEFILDKQSPSPLAPPQRAPRGSKQNNFQNSIPTDDDARQIFQILMDQDRKDLALKLIKQRKSFKQLQAELIQSIKQGQVAQDLWIAYTEALTNPIRDK
jgi:hypothetical protein